MFDFQTYMRHVIAYSKTQRRGQAYFNALYDIAPEIANRIRGTEFDPFHDDSRIVPFLSQLEKEIS
jgi:hypothetical protein